MEDEMLAKREELLAYVGRFHDADSHVGDLTEHTAHCREWLDGLFTLRTELRALEDAYLIQRTTKSYTVEIKNGSATNAERQ